MLNSLLLFFASNNKIKYLPIVSLIAWIIVYVLKTDFEYGVIFPLVSIVVFTALSMLIAFFTKGKLNTGLSTVSILIWSIIIDTISFFMFPEYVTSTFLAYIWAGIVFNFKYVFVNIAAVCAMYITMTALKEVKEKKENLD